MTDTIGSRLKAWRRSRNLKQAAAAELLQLPTSTYQNYERDTRAPNSESWKAFARAGIDIKWLLTGEALANTCASSPRDAANILRIQTQQYGKTICRADDTPEQYVEHTKETPAILLEQSWIQESLSADSNRLCLIQISSDSMAPTLRTGDTLLVDRNANTPDQDGIYAIEVHGALLIKRLRLTSGSNLLVLSDNNSFASWTIDKQTLDSDFRIFGRAVWYCRQF